MANIANSITMIRVVCSIALLFFPVFSPTFYVLYLVAGISDMIDGTVARETDSVSKLGSKLDTIADFVLVFCCLIKLLPVLHVPLWLIVWIIVIAVIKAFNLILGYAMHGEFVVPHTAMNKVTGILLFSLPLTLTIIELNYSGAVVCAVATFAAIQEGYFIRTEKPPEGG